MGNYGIFLKSVSNVIKETDKRNEEREEEIGGLVQVVKAERQRCATG